MGKRATRSSTKKTKKPAIHSLANHLLIAMPGLNDPNFERSVTYICAHDSDGAMGFVINRPLEISLGDLFEHLEIPLRMQDEDQIVLNGGPVENDHGFVLHKPGQEHWHSTWNVSEEVAITTSKDILKAMGAGSAPEEAFIALGYAGWGPGQLEQELMDNAWLTVAVDPKVIFDTPIEQRWLAATRLLGIDIAMLSDVAGHA